MTSLQDLEMPRERGADNPRKVSLSTAITDQKDIHSQSEQQRGQPLQQQLDSSTLLLLMEPSISSVSDPMATSMRDRTSTYTVDSAVSSIAPITHHVPDPNGDNDSLLSISFTSKIDRPPAGGSTSTKSDSRVSTTMASGGVGMHSNTAIGAATATAPATDASSSHEHVGRVTRSTTFSSGTSAMSNGSHINGGAMLEETAYMVASPSSVLQSLPKKKPTSASNGDISIKKFLKGFQRFHQNYFSENKSLYQTLQNGQAPKTCLIGCCDSRVDPAIITDCDPGDIFIVRNVGNLVAPYTPNVESGHHGTASALEYAVKVLKVENIIVLGHSKCGGITALMEDNTGELEFVGPWMSIAQKAKDKTIKYYGHQTASVQQKACEHASIMQSLENCTSYPWIHSKLKEGELSLNGWYFDFESGDLMAYNPETSVFEVLTDIGSPLRARLTGRDSAFEKIPELKLDEDVAAVSLA